MSRQLPSHDLISSSSDELSDRLIGPVPSDANRHGKQRRSFRTSVRNSERCHRSTDALGRRSSRWQVDIGQDDDEFLATLAKSEVAGARVLREGLTYLAKCVVTITIAVVMIECAEVIDIDEEDGCLFPGTYLSPQHESFQIGKSPAVPQPRQNIRTGFDHQNLVLRTQAKDRVGKLLPSLRRLAHFDSGQDYLVAATRFGCIQRDVGIAQTTIERLRRAFGNTGRKRDRDGLVAEEDRQPDLF